MVIGPDGKPVLRGPYGPKAEAILSCEVDLVQRPARGDLWPKLWQSASAGK